MCVNKKINFLEFQNQQGDNNDEIINKKWQII